MLGWGYRRWLGGLATFYAHTSTCSAIPGVPTSCHLGVRAFVTRLLSLLLPETLGKPLPETIQGEAERLAEENEDEETLPLLS